MEVRADLASTSQSNTNRISDQWWLLVEKWGGVSLRWDQDTPSCWVPGAAAGSLSVTKSLSLKNQASPKSNVTLGTGTATRDLPNYYIPSVAASISITVIPDREPRHMQWRILRQRAGQ